MSDGFAPDLNQPKGNIPLQDFFQFPYRDFTVVPTPPGYDANYFENYPGDPEGGDD